jgi:hypothetical protein
MCRLIGMLHRAPAEARQSVSHFLEVLAAQDVAFANVAPPSHIRKSYHIRHLFAYGLATYNPGDETLSPGCD